MGTAVPGPFVRSKSQWEKTEILSKMIIECAIAYKVVKIDVKNDCFTSRALYTLIISNLPALTISSIEMP